MTLDVLSIIHCENNNNNNHNNNNNNNNNNNRAKFNKNKATNYHIIGFELTW